MKQGLTLMEVLIVLAIVAILGAILVPNFITATNRARLRADVQSTMVIQQMMDLYNAERGATITTSRSAEEVIQRLVETGRLAEGQDHIPQIADATFELYNHRLVLNLSTSVSTGIRNNASNWLTENELRYVRIAPTTGG